MTTPVVCASCSLPMNAPGDHALGDESSPYCQFCTDETGHLQAFAERFERMVQWAIRKDGVDRAEAEVRTKDFMRSMPAWRDHPALA
jgi:hypothetical protein